jgi:hypothetical protein
MRRPEAQLREKTAGFRQPGDVVAHRALEHRDVERERAAPVVDAVPVERAVGPVENRPHQAMRLVDRDAAARCEPARQYFLPEQLVESEIEQRAVHVEQHGVDRLPVRGMGVALHPPMI